MDEPHGAVIETARRAFGGRGAEDPRRRSRERDELLGAERRRRRLGGLQQCEQQCGGGSMARAVPFPQDDSATRGAWLCSAPTQEESAGCSSWELCSLCLALSNSRSNTLSCSTTTSSRWASTKRSSRSTPRRQGPLQRRLLAQPQDHVTPGLCVTGQPYLRPPLRSIELNYTVLLCLQHA